MAKTCKNTKKQTNEQQKKKTVGCVPDKTKLAVLMQNSRMCEHVHVH